MLTVAIDGDRCVGHGRCYMLAPDVYGADDDGYGVVLQAHPGPELAAQARTGEQNCPERAVVLSSAGRPSEAEETR